MRHTPLCQHSPSKRISFYKYFAHAHRSLFCIASVGGRRFRWSTRHAPQSEPSGLFAAPSSTRMAPSGLEPVIPDSAGGCCIHWAMGPLMTSHPLHKAVFFAVRFCAAPTCKCTPLGALTGHPERMGSTGGRQSLGARDVCQICLAFVPSARFGTQRPPADATRDRWIQTPVCWSLRHKAGSAC